MRFYFEHFTAGEYVLLLFLIPVVLLVIGGLLGNANFRYAEETTFSFLCLWAGGVWQCHLRAIRRRFQDMRALDEYLFANLYSSDWRMQRRAAMVLDALAGRRFGDAVMGKRFAITVEQWKAWWEKYRHQLVWDAELRVFVTPEEYALRFQARNH